MPLRKSNTQVFDFRSRGADMRKLLTLLNAVFRSGQPYRAPGEVKV